LQESWNIKGYILEYIDETHTYLVNGVIVPSITQILKIKFGNKYNGISKEVLNRAAELGTAVHKSIEDYEKLGLESEVKELRNYKFLKKHYKFECKDNEVPIIFFWNYEEDRPATPEEIESGIAVPVAAGRLDLVLEETEKIGLGDIKRTSALDKEYVAYQLNLYRIAYQQCYGIAIKFLKALHLRENTRKYINIPISEEVTLELLKTYLEREIIC
jgi:hypothetical protein